LLAVVGTGAQVPGARTDPARPGRPWGAGSGQLRAPGSVRQKIELCRTGRGVTVRTRYGPAVLAGRLLRRRAGLPGARNVLGQLVRSGGTAWCRSARRFGV